MNSPFDFIKTPQENRDIFSEAGQINVRMPNHYVQGDQRHDLKARKKQDLTQQAYV